MVFDYIDGGAEAEITLRENTRVFDDVAFRPRSAVATRPVICGRPCSARRSRCRFCSRRSAAAACSIRAAKRPRRAPPARREPPTPCRRSRVARVEDVKAATRGPVWYQLYLVGGRDVARARD